MDEERLDKLCESIARIDERTESMKDDIDMLKHLIVEGNGSKPLMVQVAENTAAIGKVDQKIDSHAEGCIGRWKFRAAVVASVLALAGVVVQSCT